MTTRQRSSIKNELITKSREAMFSAVQIYNNPLVLFKSETFITLAIISWTYLLHGYYRSIKVDYRHSHKQGKRKIYDRTKYNAYKYWGLEKCLDSKHCPLDNETSENLRFIIGIRHEIEHQMTSRIDEYLSTKLQACAINFDYYICYLFGEKYSLSKDFPLALQFSALSPVQRNQLQRSNHIKKNISNFLSDFESNLNENVLESSKYEYKILFVPINAKKEAKADQVIEFIKSDSPLAKEANTTYTLIKETEKRKYLPSQIVQIMKEKGYKNFTISKHTRLWKSKDGKNPKKGYGVQIVNTWYWYENWLEIVEKYCEDIEN